MIKAFAKRIIFIALISITMTYLKWSFLDSTSELVFTVIGIVFSVAMSMVTSFDLSDVVWHDKRKKAKKTLRITRDELLIEFITSLIFLGLSQIDYVITIKGIDIFSVKTFSALGLIVMLIFMIDKFRSLHNLNDEISEKIASEKTNKK